MKSLLQRSLIFSAFLATMLRSFWTRKIFFLLYKKSTTAKQQYANEHKEHDWRKQEGGFKFC